MTRFHRVQLALAFMAAAGLIVPQAALAQGGTQEPQAAPAAPPQVEERAAIVVDVALSTEGRFEGVLLDEQGNPVEAAGIVIYRGEEIIAELTTDAEGRFSSSGLQAGVYRIASAQGEGMFRAWSHDAAPPTAVTSAVLVNSSDVARAQFGVLDPVGTSLILLGVTTVVLSAITLGEVEDTQDDIDDLEDLVSP
jgi:hypothetical protein